MNLKCGIIGMPNVGKSTLFNIFTRSQVAAKNFPFCTIKPNIGISPVFDTRLNKISEIINPDCVIPTFIEFVDIAGLVKGASKGEGLGNLFLDNIKNTNVIFHVVRCFIDDSIIHINNSIKPIFDIKIINMELIFSDIKTCSKEILRIKLKKKIKDEDNKKILILNSILCHLKENKMLKSLQISDKNLKIIRYLNFITLKPIIYIANISEDKKKNVCLDELLKFSKMGNFHVIPICILKESKIIKNKKKEDNFLKSILEVSSSLYSALNTAYNLLNLQTFFTVGKKEVKAWSIKKGSKSIKAARKIHTDIERGFIRAQVISYCDFIKYKKESIIRKFGKLRIEGRDYTVQDGDIMHFLFNV